MTNSLRETSQIRLDNLRRLIEKEGSVNQLALRMQLSPIYIFHVLDGTFRVGDAMARKIETSFDYPEGWIDTADERAVLPKGDVPILSLTQTVSSTNTATIGDVDHRAAKNANEPVNREVGEQRQSDKFSDQLLTDVIAAVENLLIDKRVVFGRDRFYKLMMAAAQKVLDSRGT